jgi:acyl-CoA reductase-like NAD-dependent aldehyde dehydrogenase
MAQGLYIDGTWRETAETFTVSSPWDGRHLGDIAVATSSDVDAAVSAAVRALAVTPAAHIRSRFLRDAAQKLTERAEEFAQILSAEAGKPITAARGEVGRAIETLDLSADEARRIDGKAVPMDAVSSGEGMLGFEIQAPVGVVVAITPFNFPLNLGLHKLGPALAAGCPVVWKPSEKTPLCAGALTALFDEAGVPAGMLNLVTGDPTMIVPQLLEDDRTRLVTFTGSAAIGWDIKARSPRKHHVLELGSNTAVFIAADADIDKAVADLIPSAFAFAGQACISAQRVYVADAVADRFLTALKAAADALVVGDPADERTDVGPLITTLARDRVQTAVQAAVDAGATLICGNVLDGGLLRPTVLADVPAGCSVVVDEVFGPVLSVNRVASFEEAIVQINDSRYGLNHAIYTENLSEAMQFARRAEAGAVMINKSPSYRADHMPYGGVKDSGQGREGVPEAVREMTEGKLVVLNA